MFDYRPRMFQWHVRREETEPAIGNRKWCYDEQTVHDANRAKLQQQLAAILPSSGIHSIAVRTPADTQTSYRWEFGVSANKDFDAAVAKTVVRTAIANSGVPVRHWRVAATQQRHLET